MDVCKQLIDSSDLNSKFLGAFFIYQSLRERVTELEESKDIFLSYRDLLLIELLEKLKNTNLRIIERISYSISILMAIGITNYWPQCVEDIIQYAKISKENCYVSIIILTNVLVETKELQISGKKITLIKNSLKEKSTLVSEFILLLLDNFCINYKTRDHIPEEEAEKFINQTLELLLTWIKLKLIVLKSPKILLILFLSFDEDNSNIICKIFSEAINKCKQGKFFIDDNEHDIPTLQKKCDPEELQSIELIIDFINVFINEKILEQAANCDSPLRKLLENYNFNSNFNLSKNKGKILKDKPLENSEKNFILCDFGNILCSVFENFPYLVFTKNSLSRNLMSLFFFFVSHKNRRLSSQMFICFNHIKEFINTGYNFHNFNLSEQKEFCDFLIKVLENVMSNCKLCDIYVTKIATGKKIDSVEDIEIIDASEIASKKKQKKFDLDDIYSEESENEDYHANEDFEDYESFISDDDSDLLVSDYRRFAEEIFHDIFMIFQTNFEEEGVKYFFMFLNNALIQADIDKITVFEKNDSRIYIIEVVLLVMDSIIKSFELNDDSDQEDNYEAEHLLEFIEKILDFKVIECERLLGPFLIFMDIASPFLYKREKLYLQSTEIFTRLLSVKQLENIASLILFQMSHSLNKPSFHLFNHLYDLFLKNYDNFSNYALGNFVELLTNSLGIKDEEMDEECIALEVFSFEEICKIFQMICQPTYQRLEEKTGILYNMFNIIELNNSEKSNIITHYEKAITTNKILIDQLKASFLRNFKVCNIIFRKASFLKSELYMEIFNEFMNKSGRNYDNVMRFYCRDSALIDEGSKILLRATLKAKTKALLFFDFINSMMLFLYFNNPNNLSCLRVLKALYTIAINHSSEKKEYVRNNFFELSELVQKKTLEVNKSNKKFDTITILCQMWTSIIKSENSSLVNDSTKIYNFIDFILEAFRTVSESEINKSTLKLLSTLISANNSIDRNIICNKYKDIVLSVYSFLDNLNFVSIPMVC